jgi:hypothetical protein
MKKFIPIFLLISNFLFAGNYDGGGSLHSSAVLTFKSSKTNYTSVNGYWSDAVNQFQITFNLSQSDITSASIVYHIGTSAPALTEANYAMRAGETNIVEIGKTGFPTFTNGDGGTSSAWERAFSASTDYTIYFTADNFESTIGSNNSSYNEESERLNNRIYLALLYYDESSGWELDPITDNAVTSGTDPAYLTFDEVQTSITDFKEAGTGRSYVDCGGCTINPTFGISTANFTYDLDGTISSHTVTYTRTSGIGSTSIVKTDLLATTSSGSDHSSRDWDGDDELTDGDTYTITLVVTDAAGNRDATMGGIGGSDYDDVKYDKTAPTVTGVHSEETANATFVEGETVDFYVQFSEIVDFSSVVIIMKTNTSATTNVGCHTCTNNTNKAYFNYTVLDDAYSKYFDYSATGALSGTITDQAGNSATLTLPTPATWGSVGSTNTPNSLASTSNASGGYITIDGNDPTGFAISSITPVGGNVVTNYINGTNTGQRIVVTLPTNDATIVGGKLLIEANYNNGGWGSISTPATGWIISPGEVTAGTKTDADVSVSGGSNDLDDLTGWTTGNTVQYKVTVTDANSNVGTAATFATVSTVDLYAPKVSSVTGAAGNTTARTLKSGDTEVLELNIVDSNSGASESVTFVDGGNDPSLKLETGSTDAAPTMTDPANNASATKLKYSYTVADGETSVANTDGELITHSTSPLSVGQGTIRDAAGNDLDIDISALSSPNILKDANIKVDGVSPSAIVLDSIIVAASDAGDTTVQGYWNQYSDKMTFYMAIPATGTDPTLTGGNIQLQVDFDGAYTNLGSSVDIGSGDQGNATYSIEVNAATFEGTNGWTNGDQAKFKAIITDVAGNSTTGAQAATTINIDETSPADPTIADTTTIGAPVVDGYWNSHNTSITVIANIPADGSGSGMVGGKLQFQAKMSSSGVANWADIGSPKTGLTTAGDAQGITILVASLAAHAGYAEGATITYRAVIWDKAGNKILGSAYAGTQVIDTTVPTVEKVFANTPANPLKIGDSHNITVRMSSNPTISGTPTLALDTDNTPGTAIGSASYASVSTTDMVFSYTVGAGEFALNPNYLNVNGANPVTLTSAYIRDAAGNNANLDFSALSTANKLSASLVEVDGVAPTKLTIQSVKTVGDTVRVGYWNEDNTNVKVRVKLDKNDATLANGTIQIQAIISGSYESIGAAATTVQDSVTLEYQTIEIDNTIIGGTKGLEELSNWAQLSTITFRSIVSDKAGNSTTYDVASTTLIIDENDPAAFTTDSVLTVTNEVVYGYWNGDNTAINV